MNEALSTTLWKNIREFELDDQDSQQTFTDRLARENGWSLEYSLRAVDEYKKFMFMLCIAGHPLTPSDEVDQVWHLHLLYTHSYWEDFCRDTLNKTIHHGPTGGGKEESDKYVNLYGKTKEFYKSTFNADPPAEIWPSDEIRFGEINFRRVNLDKYHLVKKLRLKLK